MAGDVRDVALLLIRAIFGNWITSTALFFHKNIVFLIFLFILGWIYLVNGLKLVDYVDTTSDYLSFHNFDGVEVIVEPRMVLIPDVFSSWKHTILQHYKFPIRKIISSVLFLDHSSNFGLDVLIKYILLKQKEKQTFCVTPGYSRRIVNNRKSTGFSS